MSILRVSASFRPRISAVLTPVLVLLGALLSPTVRSQSEASISGTVSDSSGAPIAAAIVTIRNTETGSERSVSTDQAGRYNVPSLPVGIYDLKAEKPGFRSHSRTGVTLAVGQREEIPFALPVGDVHQTVEVSANPTIVAVTTDDISGLVGERQVKDLPLNGRSY